ncbi:MAG: 6-carboxytetrahydropterin synthase [Phycisphaerae bacterium]|nr:6-carboxytetrahydropterin synthase [Phycisphaerae bacterium]
MAFEVSVSGWFAASHQLRFADGKLEPLHGHNWHVTATFAGPKLDAVGLLVDFTIVKPALQKILSEMHDRHLNDLPPFAARNPSAENVAVHIAERLVADCPDGRWLHSVAVEEAPGCVARYLRHADLPRA